MLLGMVTDVVQSTILEYVVQISDVEEKGRAIALLKSMKAWLTNSSSSTTRAIGRLLPFEVE